MTDLMPTSEQPGPSRRALVRMAAWSVPAVSLAAAVPAFAVSVPGEDPGDGCVEVKDRFSFAETYRNEQLAGHPLEATSALKAITLRVFGNHPDGGMGGQEEFEPVQLSEDPETWATTLQRRPSEEAPSLRAFNGVRPATASTYSFTFSHLVSDVTFTISGLRRGPGWSDIVRVSTSDGFTPADEVAPEGSLVTWNPDEQGYQGTADLGDMPQGAVEGQVTVHLPGLLGEFTIELDFLRGEGDLPGNFIPGQTTWLSDIEFTTSCIELD